MALTTEQLATLKAAIAADPVLNALPNNTDSAFEIAYQMNQPASPDFIVWKSNVSVDEIMRNGMAWDRVDNLSVGKARIWDWMTRLGTLDASRANIRAGIDAAWVGAAADLAVRATVYTHCKRKATRCEKLLASGTGGSEAGPATMTFEGNLSYQDAFNARNS